MPRVKVAVRSRPPQAHEAGHSCDRVETNESSNTVRVQTSKTNCKTFSFDLVYPETATQEDVFDPIEPMIEHALDGLHATVFAYGQTGSGKTYTMEGIDYIKDGAGRPRPNPATPVARHGIIPRTAEALFERARARMGRNPHLQYKIQVSYMQLYNERVTDLLNPTLTNNSSIGLKVRWNRNNKFTVDNLFHLECDSAEQMRELFFLGVKNKVMGSHAMNQQSSRSHCLFTFHITSYDPADSAATIRSELTLVDLAGSEKLSQMASDPSQQLVKESIEINASLLALGKVITSLSNAAKGRGTHIPYRDSKLTKLLQHSLGGNSMTLMIACITPVDTYAEESLSTLMYAGRARNITNDPHVNEDPRTKLIRQLREEIVSLKEQLAQYQSLAAAGLSAPINGGGTTSNSPARARATDPSSCGPSSSSGGGGGGGSEAELSDKLLASCGMLKNLIDVNGKLRIAFDRLKDLKDGGDQREVELQAENLSLRERIEVLESIVLTGGDEAGVTDGETSSRPSSVPTGVDTSLSRSGSVAAPPPRGAPQGVGTGNSATAGARAATPVMKHQVAPPPRRSTPVPATGGALNSSIPGSPSLPGVGQPRQTTTRPAALRESVDANRSAVRSQHQTKQQKLSAYSRKYRDPRGNDSNYAAFYGLAKKATAGTNAAQAKIVADVDALLKKTDPGTASMVPLSLQSVGQFGSLAFGGTQNQVSELEERRRQRALRRAELEARQRQLQQGFASIDAALAAPDPVSPARVSSSGGGALPSARSQASMSVAGAMPGVQGTAPSSAPGTRTTGGTSEQLFDYLSTSESANVFTADQLSRLRERRGVGGSNPPPVRRSVSGSGAVGSSRRQDDRERQYQRELQSAQQLVSSLKGLPGGPKK